MLNIYKNYSDKEDVINSFSSDSCDEDDKAIIFN